MLKKPFVGALGVLLLAGAANADLFGLDSNFPGSVYQINPNTGAATLVVTSNASGTSLVGATFLGGQFYGTDILGIPGGGGGFEVGQIDLGSGNTTFVSNQDGSANWHGLASDEGAGLMYAINQDAGNILTSLTPGGTTVQIGAAGIDGRGMAYDDGNGILYATGVGDLYTVSTTTGLATLIGPLGFTTSRYGLAFDEDTGSLYGIEADGAGSSLYLINTATGATTLIGSNSFNIDGLGWIPTPGVLPMLGLGMLAIRRRR